MRSRVQTMGLRVAMLLCGAGLVVASAVAQDGPPPPPHDGQQQAPPPGGGRGGMRGGNPEMRAKMLQRQLGLTDDVTAQVKTIFVDGTTKMEALRGGSTAPEDRRAQMMAIHTTEVAKVNALLTPDQQAKYAEMEKRMRERREGGGGPPPDGGGPPPPAPPQ